MQAWKKQCTNSPEYPIIKCRRSTTRERHDNTPPTVNNSIWIDHDEQAGHAEVCLDTHLDVNTSFREANTDKRQDLQLLYAHISTKLVHGLY